MVFSFVALLSVHGDLGCSLQFRVFQAFKQGIQTTVFYISANSYAVSYIVYIKCLISILVYV